MSYDWEILFHELTFKERIKLITSGLKQPKDSGEHKEARHQLTRLASPFSAITVPIIMLLMIGILTGVEKAIKTTGPISYVKEKPMPEKLEEIEKIKPDVKTPPIKEFLKEISSTPSPSDSEAPQDTVKISQDTTPSLQTFKSPVFSSLRPSNGAKIRGDGLESGGGSPETERTVMQALRWLKHVQESDGSWKQESGGGPGKGTEPAMTGLALLTFLAHGDTPGSEEFGETVEKAIKWLLANQEPSGHFKGRDNHDYSHPIATYALCEAFSMTRIPMVKEASEKAVKIIVDGQNLSGGWDYNCKQSDRNDTSYMGWCVQALKAAYTAELSNPGLAHAIEKAAKGLERNANAGGGFGYTGPQPSNLTGVGVLCLQLLEKPENVAVKEGIRWLERATFSWNAPWGNDPLYYWYYVTQVKFRASRDIWDIWNPIFSTELVNNQTVLTSDDEDVPTMGYWKAPSEKEHCKSYVYNTTLCTLMLEVYYRNLQTFRWDDHLLKDEDEFAEEKPPVEIIISKSTS